MQTMRIDGYTFEVNAKPKDPDVNIVGPVPGEVSAQQQVMTIPILVLKEFVEVIMGNRPAPRNNTRQLGPVPDDSKNDDATASKHVTYQSQALSELLDVMYEIQGKI